MTNNVYQSNEPTAKKSKKPYFIIGGIVLFVILLVAANVSKAKQEKEAQQAIEEEEEVTEEVIDDVVDTQLSESELQQQALIQAFGEPPAGFRWDDEGNPIPISDSTLTGEEVVFNYLRSLSILDMANAAKYAKVSTVLNTYDSYYELMESSEYRTQFARKLYSEVITSIEVDSVERTAVFANGRRIFTVNIDLLDLSNKDFWRDDSEEIFTTLRSYLSNEDDTVKAEQYVMGLILDYFSRDDAKKRTIQVDIVLDKVRLGGWLVVDDADLNTACTYKDGTSVYQAIMAEYSKWLADVLEKEADQAVKAAEAKAKAKEDSEAEEESEAEEDSEAETTTSEQS